MNAGYFTSLYFRTIYNEICDARHRKNLEVKGEQNIMLQLGISFSLALVLGLGGLL